ncbi:MAG: hypothetical protein IJ424_04705 [Oscillospiraceae bacterium]|nr:hypothetical protein [Oscillospiraceae bacterium]
MKKTSILIKSTLWLFVCWLASFVIVMFFPMCYQNFGNIMCFVFGFCSIGACVCLYADYAHKLGGKMRLSTDSEETIKKQQHFGLFAGIAPTAINYIYVIILYLSKFGIVPFDFFPWYKTLTFYFMPLTYLFAPNEAVYIDGRVTAQSIPAAELSAVAMIIITVLPLIFIATTWAAYYLGYNHISLKEKIVYRR